MANISTFVFSPGHKIRITNFIEKTKQEFVCKQQRKRRNISDSDMASAKKVKVASEAIALPTVKKFSNCPSYNLQSITDDIRKRIIKWQRTQKLNKLRQLKEHKGYTVSIMLNEFKYVRNNTGLIRKEMMATSCFLTHKEMCSKTCSDRAAFYIGICSCCSYD